MKHLPLPFDVGPRFTGPVFDSHKNTSADSCTCTSAKKSLESSRFCVSSLRRGHANLLCIVPILTDGYSRRSSGLRRRTTWLFFAQPKTKSQHYGKEDLFLLLSVVTLLQLDGTLCSVLASFLLARLFFIPVGWSAFQLLYVLWC